MCLYEVRIRFQGSVSTVQVNARDSAQAKVLVKAQYSDSKKVTVLQAKPVK